MASIRIGGGQPPWVVARWAVHYVLDQVNYSGMSDALAKQIAETTKHQLGYLDLETITMEDRTLFAAQVKRIAGSLEQVGPNSLATPIIFDDLLEGLRELQHLVEASAFTH